MKLLSLISAFVCLIALGGCLQKDLPRTGTYVVTEIDGTTLDASEPVSVTYEDDRLAGKGPVNNWAVPVLEDGKLGVGISTRMAGPPEKMELENKLLQALDGGRLEAASQHSLAITKDGQTVILLKPASVDAAEAAQ